MVAVSAPFHRRIDRILVSGTSQTRREGHNVVPPTTNLSLAIPATK